MAIALTISPLEKGHVNVLDDHIDDNNTDEGASLEELK
jgi:hypothetical protein